jgi:hypothetical protein
MQLIETSAGRWTILDSRGETIGGGFESRKAALEWFSKHESKRRQSVAEAWEKEALERAGERMRKAAAKQAAETRRPKTPFDKLVAFKKRSAASRRQHKVRRDKKRTMAMLRYFNRPAPDSTPEFIQFEGRERIRAENELRRRAYYRKQKEAMKP